MPDGFLRRHLHLDPALPFGRRVFGDGGLERGCGVDPGLPGDVGRVCGVAAVGVDGRLLQLHEIIKGVWHPGILRGDYDPLIITALGGP